MCICAYMFTYKYTYTHIQPTCTCICRCTCAQALGNLEPKTDSTITSTLHCICQRRPTPSRRRELCKSLHRWLTVPLMWVLPSRAILDLQFNASCIPFGVGHLSPMLNNSEGRRRTQFQESLATKGLRKIFA